MSAWKMRARDGLVGCALLILGAPLLLGFAALDVHRKMRRRWGRSVGALGAAVAVAVAAVPARAADATPPPQQPAAPSVQLVAAGWCAVHGSSSTSSTGSSKPPGCDVGLGVALQQWHRLAIVAAIGSHTAGAGLAWLAGYIAGKPIAVSVGIIAPYDAHGIDAGNRALAIGATWGFK